MSKKQLKFSFRGVLLLCSVFVGLLFLVAAFFVYNNLKSVEQNVLNLREQMRSTTSKLNDFSQPKLNQVEIFKEMTKDWEKYFNESFSFQLKHPTAWGKLAFTSPAVVNNVGDQKNIALFENLKDSGLVISILKYEAFDDSYKFASPDVKNALWQNKVGECQDGLFQKITELKVGDVRNCFVRENIYSQRFLFYRYVQKVDNQIVEKLIAVFPRDNYYLKVELPDAYSEELEYFLESIIFL
jgi:hypothetical protein